MAIFTGIFILCPLDIHQPNLFHPLPLSFPHMGRTLSVPLVNQPRGSKLCWAACAVMVSDYFNGPEVLNMQEILDHFSLPPDSPGSNGMAAMFLDATFNLSWEDIGLDPQRFKQCIDGGIPIILDYSHNNGGHAVVLTGYVTSKNSTTTFIINDPEENGPLPVISISSYAGMKLTSAFAIGANRFQY